jgi:hypothetical protein
MGSEMVKGLVVLHALLFMSRTGAAQVSIQGSPVYRQESRGGETYTGAIVLTNTTSEPQEAKLYATDYTTSADGATIYGEPGTTRRSNARWVTLGASRVIVPPNKDLSVPFTVVVPAADSLSGSYWSMVMVEAVPRGAPESSLPGPRQGQMGLVTKIRYAAQIITDLNAGAARDAKFEAPSSVIARDGTRALTVDLRNTGTLAFEPRFKLDLYTEEGTHLKTLSGGREVLYPTHTMREQFILGKLPPGNYRAVITVDTGEGAVFGAQYLMKM